MKRKYSKKLNRVWREDRHRKEKILSWKRSGGRRKSWVQGVGRRKRGGTGEGGSDDLISARCHSKYSHPLSLSLSVQQTHTNTPWLNLCQYEVRSPSLPFPCTTATFISSPCTCVCVRLSQPLLPDIPQQMWDWLLGYRNKESQRNIIWICAVFKTTLDQTFSAFLLSSIWLNLLLRNSIITRTLLLKHPVSFGILDFGDWTTPDRVQ